MVGSFRFPFYSVGPANYWSEHVPRSQRWSEDVCQLPTAFWFGDIQVYQNRWMTWLTCWTVSKIENTGFVFLTDSQGDVQIHRERSRSDSSLQQLYGPQASLLLNKSGFNLITTESQGQNYSSRVFMCRQWTGSFIGVICRWWSVCWARCDCTKDADREAAIVALVFILMGVVLANEYHSSRSKLLAKRFGDLGEGDGDLAQRGEVKGNIWWNPRSFQGALTDSLKRFTVDEKYAQQAKRFKWRQRVFLTKHTSPTTIAKSNEIKPFKWWLRLM